MNKQELISELSNKFYKVGRVALVDLSPTDQAIRDEEGVKWYIAGVYEKSGDRLIRKNISFYVEAEGTAEESALYTEKLPDDSLSKSVVTTFRDLIKTEIDRQISEGILLRGIIETVDEDGELGFAMAYQVIAEEVVIKRYFAYNDTAKKFQFKPMKDI